jgi:hypothetical protein
MLWLIPRGDCPWPVPPYRDRPHAVVYSSLILEVVGLDQKIGRHVGIHDMPQVDLLVGDALLSVELSVDAPQLRLEPRPVVSRVERGGGGGLR